MKLFTTLAWLFLGLVAVQFFLAGIGIFGAGSFDAHVINGTLLLVVALALSIVAAVTRMGRAAVTMSAVLLVATFLQGALPAMREDAPVVAALHPLTALVLVVLGYALARGSTLAELARPAR